MDGWMGSHSCVLNADELLLISSMAPKESSEVCTYVHTKYCYKC
jgi:hypothetical protein